MKAYYDPSHIIPVSVDGQLGASIVSASIQVEMICQMTPIQISDESTDKYLEFSWADMFGYLGNGNPIS